MTTETQPDRDTSMPLMEHLYELRGRVAKAAIAVALGAVVGWILYPSVQNFLMGPLATMAKKNPAQVKKDLQSFDPLEIFMLRMKVSAYLGFVLALPVVLYQLWKFIAPGLYKNERRYAGGFIVSSIVLFLFGAAIAYWTLPAALEFLTSVGGNDVTYQYTATNYLMLIVYMMVAFGLGFEFPVLLVMLQLVGVLTPQQLSKFRRFAIVGNAVIAAVITPSADPISMSALLIPMCIFYEIAILIGRVVLRRRRHAADAETDRAAG
jgi:sec-independent protein translocase protein TatC